MTATGHALIGATIAAKVSNPLIGIPLALFSHVIADALPHWDTATNRRKKSKNRFFMESAIDVGAGFLLSFLFLHYFFPQTNFSYAFFMIIAAQFLDWVTAPYLFLCIKHPPFTWAYKFQKSFDNRLDMPWGVIDQVGIVAAVIFFAKFF